MAAPDGARMTMFLTALARRLGPVLAVVLAAAVLWLHGFGAGKDNVRALWEADRVAQARAVSELRAQHAAATAAAAAAVETRIRNLNARHAKAQADLREALRRSELDRVALSRDLVRLHDRAALGADAPADAPVDPSGAAGTPPSVADLVETCLANYGIAERNAERLSGWQEWWRGLSSGAR